MINLLSRTIMMGTPLLFGAIAEVIAERTGMMVTAIEGIFLMGAWAGFVGSYLSGSLAMGFLFAILTGIVVAALYVPITPLTINPLAIIPIPLLSEIPLIGKIFFSQNILTYIIYILAPLSYFMLYKTSVGLTIRSAGENPEAVDVAGINVYTIRFLTVLLAGAMGGVAGAFYSIGFLGMFTTNIIGGRGWIAFAICFLGNWNPRGAVIGTLAFGFAEAIAIYMQSIGSNALFPNELFIAIPYIMTIVLTISRKSFNVPAKLGVPYIKEN